jgi:hypothetical protein
MAEKTVEIPPLGLSLGFGPVAPLPPYQTVARQYITSETEGRWSNRPESPFTSLESRRS